MAKTKEEKAAYQKAYREKNKERLSIKQKEYRERNRDFCIAISKKYHEEHKDAIKKQRKIFYDANKDRLAKDRKTYYDKTKNDEEYLIKRRASKRKLYHKNSEKIKARRRELHNKNKEERNARRRELWATRSDEYKEKYLQRVKGNINVKLSILLRSRIRSATKKTRKVSSHIKDLGCTIEFLKSYIESLFTDGMTWENRGRYGWHIDHIFPLSKFDLTNEEEFKKACHYTNLQPLWAFKNLSKGNKIIEGVNDKQKDLLDMAISKGDAGINKELHREPESVLQ